MIQIVEILGRSEQGRTRPFLCAGDDGRRYYVKGRRAGRRSQLCEWTAAHLARTVGLPIADFEVVQVPRGLVELDMPHLDLQDLGSGPAFGSAQVLDAAEFAAGDRRRVPAETRRAILVFDWWIRNDDRTLTDRGGNPNLLWDVARKEVAVIDHNLAFNSAFDAPTFMETHAFGQERRAVWSDLVERVERVRHLSAALPMFRQACDNAPDEWWFADDDGGVPVNFDRTAVQALLERCESPDFWNIEP